MSTAVRVLLADSARLLSLLAGLAFTALVAAGALTSLDLEGRVLVALALMGWTLILFGPRAQAWLDDRVRGTLHHQAPQRLVEDLLRTADLADLASLWRRTIDRVFAPALRESQPVHRVSRDTRGTLLSVPDVAGAGWVLRSPRRALAMYDERDEELARQLWQLVEPVREAFLAFELGKRRERERLAEVLMMQIEMPLHGIGARPDAAPLADRFERCAAQIEAVRLDLLGEPCTIEAALLEQQNECATRLAEAGIACIVRCEAVVPSTALDARRSAYLRSLMREAVTNVIRHSGAQNASLAIRMDDQTSTLYIELEDDGRGFDPATVAGGQGLMNMRRRAAAIGATAQWVQPPSGGTRVVLEWSQAGRETGAHS